jgi:hypothetical protein
MLASLIILLAATFMSVGASAETYISEGSTPVYSKPDRGSELLGKLKDGREVEIEKKSSKWIKVILNTSKGKKKGFIPVSASASETEVESPSEFGGFRLGISIFYTYYYQSSRVFTDTDGNQSDIGTLTGSDPYFGFLAEYPYSKKMMMRAGFSLRKINLKGTVKYRSGAVTTTDTPVEIKQEFFSFLGGVRYSFWGPLWGGIFGEFAVGSKSTVFGTDGEKPSYFILQPAVGYDYKFAKNFFVLPEFRLGLFLNTKPFMFNPEVMISTGWEF